MGVHERLERMERSSVTRIGWIFTDYEKTLSPVV